MRIARDAVRPMYFTPMLQQSRTNPPKDLDASLYAEAIVLQMKATHARVGGSGTQDAGQHRSQPDRGFTTGPLPTRSMETSMRSGWLRG